ncbi:hypothetical protein KR044_011313 [Drosophila immigrans]|nr:hypothetical protein KR044_011313 [Drosophila immigrans]
MRSDCFEVPLKPPRRQRDAKGDQQAVTTTATATQEREQLLRRNLSGSNMYSNLRYARTNLSHSSLLLNQQQSSFDGSEHPTSTTTTERTESSETLDTPLSTTATPTVRELAERERERERDREREALPLSLPLAGCSRPLLPPAASRRYALASALHATAKLAASVDAYTAAATANTTVAGDYSLCDSYRPSRLGQYQQQQQQQQQQLGISRYNHSVASSIVGSTRYLNYSNLHSSNSPHASSRRFNAQQTHSSPPPLLSSASFPLPGSALGPLPLSPAAAASVAAASSAPPPIVQSYSSACPVKLRTYQEHQISRFQPRRHTARSSMSQSGEDLHSPTYLSWRKLQLSRAKLKASSKTSALLSGFAMVAMVEVQLDKETAVPPGMLVAFAICTTLLVAVHMLALMISTCILPNIETVCNLHSISLVHESPHERLHWYIETAWAFSTLLGLMLFLVEIAILCWVKFYDLSTTAAWSAVVVLIPVMVVFLAFAVHFYRSLVTHKYEVTVSGIRELEMLKEQMEQDHLEIHNNSRNNGFNYGASGDIV